VKGRRVAVGGPRLLTEANVPVPPELAKRTAAWSSDGKTVLYAVGQEDCSELSRLKMRSVPNLLQPSPNFTALVSGSR